MLTNEELKGESGKNIPSNKYVKRALIQEYMLIILLVDSWYAKPNFINEVKQNGLM
jgi:hypothetical protein